MDVSIKINAEDPAKLQIILSGRLDMHTVTELWPKCMELQNKYSPELLTLDVQEITYCNGAGIGLLTELAKRQQSAGNKCIIQGF